MPETYKSSENKGEILFNQVAFLLDLRKTHFTHTTCSYDVKGLSATTYYIGEIKVRIASIDTTLKFRPYLEHIKLLGMQRSKAEILRKTGISVMMIYLDFCTDGVVVYQLEEEHKYEWKEIYLPHTKVGDQRLEGKWVTELMKPIRIIEYGKKD